MPMCDWSSVCSSDLENNRMGKTRDLFKKIRDTKGTFHAKMDSIKDRNGMDLTEAEDIKRWYLCLLCLLHGQADSFKSKPPGNPKKTNIHTISVLYRVHLCMQCSLGISDFLEEISSLSHSVVFLYFFALIVEEDFLISSCYSLELCIQVQVPELY